MPLIAENTASATSMEVQKRRREPFVRLLRMWLSSHTPGSKGALSDYS
jgi:hypothetical protein